MFCDRGGAVVESRKRGIRMQDRYLFKAKRKDNGEWVEGFYFCMTHTDGRHTHHFIIPLGADLSLGTPVEKIQVEVDQSTICQCTGLKDKNGKVIWENDIVKHYNDGAHPENYCTGTVLWDENYAEFYRTSNEYGLSKPRISSDCIYEVVGNVFDNPELLEEKYGDIAVFEKHRDEQILDEWLKTHDRYDYCKNCGQKLDWRDEV